MVTGIDLNQLYCSYEMSNWFKLAANAISGTDSGPRARGD
jgi:hypothetical protein